jgi:site-specific DNA-methyltransferase (cytosine-N4-specific)
MDRIIEGDCLEELKKLPKGSVHCCVTSPPYWGLRDYGNRKWLGGRLDCPHSETEEHASTDPGEEGNKFRAKPTRTCLSCGAWFGQLGLEPKVDSYVEHLVLVFRDVRDILHPSGTLWLNIGDGYARQGGVGAHGKSAKVGMTRSGEQRRNCKPPEGLKSKDLIGIPWRLAFALQEDGWWLRAENIWHKPNAMPSSATDRTTRAHEQVFMFAKSEKYFYDHEAVRDPSGGNKRSVWRISSKPYPEAHFAVFPPELPETCILAGTSAGGCCNRCFLPYEREMKKMLDDGIPIADVLTWCPACKCENQVPIPCTVLDPFLGSGTTAEIAKKMGRRYIGIEVNPAYVKIALERTKKPDCP